MFTKHDLYCFFREGKKPPQKTTIHILLDHLKAKSRKNSRTWEERKCCSAAPTHMNILRTNCTSNWSSILCFLATILATCDYYLPQNIKRFLEGKKFNAEMDVCFTDLDNEILENCWINNTYCYKQRLCRSTKIFLNFFCSRVTLTKYTFRKSQNETFSPMHRRKVQYILKFF